MGRKRFALLAAVLLLISGCVPIRVPGTTHYLVVGLGVVSVSTTNATIAQVTKSSAVGLVVSQHGLAAGLSSGSVVAIKTNADVNVEVKQMPFKSLNVCVPSK